VKPLPPTTDAVSDWVMVNPYPPDT